MALPAHVPASAPQTAQELFERARQGDAAAADAFCRLLRPRAYRAAYALVRDRDEADDLAQEALVRALTRHRLFLGLGSVEGWVLRIAVNLAKNRLRDGKRRSELLRAEAPALEPTADPGAAEVAQRREERARLQQALASLSPREQQVVALRATAGLDFKDVAHALSISEANARMAFSTAKARLRTLLGATP